MHINHLSINKAQSAKFCSPIKIFGKDDMNDGKANKEVAYNVDVNFHLMIAGVVAKVFGRLKIKHIET